MLAVARERLEKRAVPPAAPAAPAPIAAETPVLRKKEALA